LLVYREADREIPKALRELLSLLGRLKGQVLVHPISLKEIETDKNLPHTRMLLSKLETYPVLDTPPNPDEDSEFLKAVGLADSFREDADNRILYCVYQKDVDLVVTEDPDLHQKAEKAGMSDGVFSLKDAVSFLRKKIRFEDRISQQTRKGTGPVLVFYKAGNTWRIGERGKTGFFENLKGFDYIHFLLQHPDQHFDPIQVYHLGSSTAPEPRIDRETTPSSGRSHQTTLDRRSRREAGKQLCDLREEVEMAGGENPELIASAREEIECLEAELKRRTLRDPAGEKARLNVTKGIGRVLKKIKDAGGTPNIEKYLNAHTIKTGDSVRYAPISSDTPTWILSQDELE
jgi:hypothetical protein